MTPTRLRECLALLRWSQRGLADALGRDEGTVRMMARGTRPIPGDVAIWLERLAVYHETNPAPLMRDERARLVVGMGKIVRLDTTVKDYKADQRQTGSER